MDFSRGCIEIYPLFKSPQSERVRKYNSTLLNINQLLKNCPNQVKSIILDYPEKSTLKIKYTLTTNEPNTLSIANPISELRDNKSQVESGKIKKEEIKIAKGLEVRNKDKNDSNDRTDKEVNLVEDPKNSKFKNLLNIFEKQTSGPVKNKIQRKSSNSLTKINLEKLNSIEPKISIEHEEKKEEASVNIKNATLRVDNSKNRFKDNLSEIETKFNKNNNKEILSKFPSATVTCNKNVNPDKIFEPTTNKEVNKTNVNFQYFDKNLERNSNISSDNNIETINNLVNKSIYSNFKSNSFLHIDDSNKRNNSSSNKSDFNTVDKSRLSTQIKSSHISNNTVISNNDFKINEYTVIDCKEEKFVEEEYPHDSFCEAFFGVSLPISNPKLINQSDKFIPPCKHENCGMLPAYKPEIVFRVPFQDNKKFDLNSIVFEYLNRLLLCVSQKGLNYVFLKMKARSKQ